MSSIHRVRHVGSALRALIALSVASLAIASEPEGGQPPMKIDVDVTDVARQLLHAEVELAVDPGPVVLWYPKWVPGIHGPRGPVQNLAGLSIESPDGDPIHWRRDDVEPSRFHVDVPSDTDRIRIRLDYICNQSTTNSIGVDAHGTADLAIVNFNTCLLYPEGRTNRDLDVELTVRMPEDWRFATSLTAEDEQPGRVRFARTSLQDMVDSPLICGRNFRSIALDDKSPPKTRLQIVSETTRPLDQIDSLVDNYRRLVAEAELMFGSTPYDEYQFLLCFSDQIGSLGLEHLRCSLNGMNTSALFSQDSRRGWIAELLPHEYVHAWCGKFRRPAGMATGDYHTPKQTQLLWVYEGLTTYLAEVLTARCGLHTYDQYVEHLNATVSRLAAQRGRQWRSLEDTAIASHQLRANSRSWNQLRRGQDYYHEGMLYWLEADALIREKTDGARSLDDFCQSFFVRSDGHPDVHPFDVDDVYRTLGQVVHHDWRAFFEDRVLRHHDRLPLTVIDRCGYRLEYSAKPTDYLRLRERQGGSTNLLDSIGMSTNRDGRVNEVVPGSAADDAGLAPHFTIYGVDGFKFSPRRLKDAVTDSVADGRIELLLLNGDRFETRYLEYGDGLRYLRLTPDPDKPDRLRAIVRPRATTADPASAGS